MKYGIRKSHIEIHLGVIRNLLEDIAGTIETSASLRKTIDIDYVRECRRDYDTIVSRTTAEGEEFLTKTLPRLGKWFDQILSSYPDHPNSVPLGFKPYRNTPYGCAPVFLRVFMHVIFSRPKAPDDDIFSLEKAKVIRLYRSLLYLFYKLEVPPTEDILRDALQKWIDHERGLSNFDFPSYYDSDVIGCRELIETIFRNDEDIFTNISPRHGPGAVAGGEVGDEKWVNRSRIEPLHSVYPRYDLYYGFRVGGRIPLWQAEQMISDKKSSKGGGEIATSRLLFVPKDSRGPRTISCEPVQLMFVQQGVARNMMKVIFERTLGHVNFEDQTINGSLALRSSKDGELATVDLKDASDSVSVELVRLLCPEWTQKYLFALRSVRTMLPSGELVTHRKYAPMGSAICFPLESLIFWSITVRACVNAGYDLPTAKAMTYVYGDDIITISDVVPHLVALMAKFAIKVNLEKTFSHGSFRESCGVDAFLGFDVTPLRIKKILSLRSRDGLLATAICKYASTCFQLDMRKTGQYLTSLVEDIFGIIPRYYRPLGCLSIVDPSYVFWNLNKFQPTWDDGMCAFRIKGWVVSPSRKESSLEGLSRRLKLQYGSWAEHDPSSVVVPRATKTRKRDILVEMDLI